MGYRLCAVLALVAVGCSNPVHSHVDWPPGADLDSHVAGDCVQAGNVLERLGCKEARDWLPFCRAAQDSQGVIDVRVGCIASAQSVEAVRECRVKCQ